MATTLTAGPTVHCAELKILSAAFRAARTHYGAEHDETREAEIELLTVRCEIAHEAMAFYRRHGSRRGVRMYTLWAGRLERYQRRLVELGYEEPAA